MSYRPGDAVHVIPLGRTGVVISHGRSGRLQVRVGALTIECREHDLRSAPQQTQRSATGTIDRPKRRLVSQGPVRAKPGVPPALDLHGMTVAEAVPFVESFLSDALLAGESEVHIVHGIGTGALQRAVHARLRELPVVAHYRVDSINPGVTRVFL